MIVKENSSKAFSILELLIVISILTILIGIGMPRIKGFMDNAKVAQAKKEIQTIQSAIESYYTFVTPKSFPPTSASVGATYLTQVQPQVLSSVLYDPFAGTGSNTEYSYIRSTNSKYYVVYSLGLNGTATNLAIANTGVVSNLDADDFCATNGNGCEPGGLQCSSPFAKCNGVCVNVSNNDTQCGSCTNDCTTGGGTCSGFVCIY